MKQISVFTIVAVLCALANYAGYEPSYAQSQIPVPMPANTSNATQPVIDLRIEGNTQVTNGDIIKIIKTKQGRPFNATTLEEDIRTLMQRRWFVDVKPKVERTPEGYIITITCIERQLIRYIKVSGNKKHTRKILLEEANIKEGDALDPIAIHQAKEKMAQFYRETGFHQVHIDVLRGDEPGDRGVVFYISEGPQQRVLNVEFQGNKIATSERLKTLIQSKPGFFFWINSEFTRKKLDDDVETLINYYRKLGFFYAKVDRVFEETSGYTGMGQNRGWVKVKFVIDEGPRCKIRNIRFEGNHVFSDDELLKLMKLGRSRNQFYNQDALEIDMQTIKERYGDHGYVFAMPMPDPRVEQDYVDLIVNVREGPRCYLETLDIEIRGNDGAESYTKWQPALNRISLRPGDLLRTSEINASRRRLMASALFNTNPMQGAVPEFHFDYPKEALEMEAAFEREREREQEREAERIASGDSKIRGQSPPQQPVRLNPGFLPLTQPVIQVPPQNRPLQQPTLQSVQSGGIIRGQAPAANLATTFTPPPYQPQASPAPIYPSNWGSIAPSAAPLQTSNTAASNTASALGMTQVQFQPGADTATILGNSNDTYLGSPFSDPQAPGVRFDPNAPLGVSPYIYGVRGKWTIQETRTGTLMASLSVSSDAGLMGRFVFEEQNFDIMNYPRGFRLSDWRNAFRGRGQRFRIEAMPGTQVQRYSASWETPYLFDLDYSFGINGFYYQRYYNEWNEDRMGGAISFGRLWTPDISTRLSLGGQQVNIYRAMQHVYEEGVVGKHPMYNIGLSATYNTRDSEYMPTEGHLITAGVEQVLGDYQFVRGNVDLRKYFMLRERPDRSGRWVLGIRSSLAVTESGTPIYERYFGGGFTNLRGFEFRGVSPRTATGDVLGGCMEFYNSAELIFPLTADDMIRGSIFIDTGTVESSISRWEEDYRVAMGFGLRLTIPMMGPAPIALDFAFPLSSGRWDDKQVFSFGMSYFR